MNTTDNMVSTTTSSTVDQTTENTVAPHESMVAPTLVPKKKRIRLTPEERARRIAEGWNPPGPRPRNFLVSARGTVDPNIELGFDEPLEDQVGEAYGETEADEVLRALVEKMLALENNEQYKNVWYHFFSHGGVYNGPNYHAELRAACDYLNSKVAKQQKD